MRYIMDMNQNLTNLMKEAQKMQQRMQDAQAELASLTVEGKSGGNLVIVTMKGNHESTIKINPMLLKEDDIEMLEDLINAAYNDAVRKIEKASKSKISQLTSGLNIPTDFMKDDDKE